MQKNHALFFTLLRQIPPAAFLPAALSSLAASLAGIILMGASAYLIASAALHPPLYTLALAITLVRACGISRAAFRYLDRWLSHRITFQLLTRLRAKVYLLAEACLPLKAGGTSQGAFLHDLTVSVDLLRDFYLRVLAPPLLTLLLTLWGVFFLYPVQPSAAFLLLLCWLLSLLLPALLHRTTTVAANSDAAYRSCLLDTLAGLSELQCAGQTADSLRRLDTAAETLQQQMALQTVLRRQEDFSTDLCRRTAFIAIVLLLVSAAIDARLTGIELAVYLLALQTILDEFSVLPEAVRALYHALPAARRLQFSTDIGQTAAKTADIPLPAITPKDPVLTATDISFSYAGHPVLQNLNFNILAGEHLAITGESGSGKTTLFHLLLRLWEPDHGSFFLHGSRYDRLSPSYVRQNFAALTQGCYIFNDSIEHNFRRLYPTISLADIWQALEKAQLATQVSQWPQKLHTVLGEDGARLSGGQRQRLLLALAFASPAPILLLDEPTSGLDKKTAHGLLQALQKHCKERTLLIITHDLPALHTLDRVLHLENGRLASPPSP